MADTAGAIKYASDPQAGRAASAKDAAQSGSIPLTSFSIEELGERVEALGESRYRGDQIGRWLYRRSATDISQMTDLSSALREKLKRSFHVHGLRIERSLESLDGVTRKLLLAGHDRVLVESVLLPRRRGLALCLSSQAGCSMGCPFCATGLGGLRRNLTAGEIVDQFLLARSLALASGTDIGSIVYMGMGEPLANLDNVKRSVERLVSDEYCGLGARRITLSTIGRRGRIRNLAGWPWKIGLAISLHAPNDEVRRRLVPPSRSFGLAELMAESVYYQRKTGRRVSYEYVMLESVNDSNDQAKALGDLLVGQLCHVNLIPYNAVAGANYRGSASDTIEGFRRTLEATGVAVTIRRPRGRDIAAACGQLAGARVEGSP